MMRFYKLRSRAELANRDQLHNGKGITYGPHTTYVSSTFIYEKTYYVGRKTRMTKHLKDGPNMVQKKRAVHSHWASRTEFYSELIMFLLNYKKHVTWSQMLTMDTS